MKHQFRNIKRSPLAFILFIALCVTFAGLTFMSQARAQKMDIRNELSSLFPGPPQSIAFTSGRDTNNEIYVMDPDGMMQTRKTNSTSNDQRPDISPDGRQIVFASNRVMNHFEIFIMNFDGSTVRQLTTTVTTVNNSWPRWSPDGEWIAFQSGGGSNFQIYRVRPDGTDLTQVTNYVGLNQFPGWSPDGTRLVIRRDTEIYSINSTDGSDPVRLTFTNTIPGAFNQMASFSPDGTKIAYLSNNRDSDSSPVYLSVYIMDSDGNNKLNFTRKPDAYGGIWTSRAPAWSPNGQYVYFTAVRSLRADTASRENIFVRPVDCFEEACETPLTTTGVNAEASVRKVFAPTIRNVTATPNVLWPPKNQMVPVALTVDVTDNSDPAPVCHISDVTSNEDTLEPAWDITGPLSLDLRAQRFGMFRGRTYTVTITCTNTSQLSSTAAVAVRVPHDQRSRDND